MAEMAKTLPAKYYTDPEHFRKEMQTIFREDWICVGRADQIPSAGDYFLREIDKENLILTRGADGKVRALHNVCRHRGTQMCEEKHGSFKGSIQCPYHAWTWSLDGKMTGAPHMNEVPGFAMEDYPLHQAHCDEWEGHLFVNFSKNPPPLLEQLGGLVKTFAPWHMGELRMAKRVEYSVPANWKLILQNYSECLHCPMIHPALSKLSHYMSGDNEPAQRHYMGGHMTLKDGITTMSFSGQSNRKPLPHLGETEKRRVYYYAVLPNMLLSCHPDYMMTHTLWPKSAGETEIICEFHFHPDEMKRPGFSPDDAVEFWDTTNRQDWQVSILSQRGIASSVYEPGPYSLREGLLRQFDEMLLERIERAPRGRWI